MIVSRDQTFKPYYSSFERMFSKYLQDKDLLLLFDLVKSYPLEFDFKSIFHMLDTSHYKSSYSLMIIYQFKGYVASKFDSVSAIESVSSLDLIGFSCIMILEYAYLVPSFLKNKIMKMNMLKNIFGMIVSS